MTTTDRLKSNQSLEDNVIETTLKPIIAYQRKQKSFSIKINITKRHANTKEANINITVTTVIHKR
jgi:hypothetical protein